jgi:hypothetical protein
MNHKQNSTSGLNLLIKDVEGFSQAQAAWRFYNNENVDIPSLNNPIIQEGLREINELCEEYVLVANDWSHVDYRHHEAKKECIESKRNKEGYKKQRGYDLQSSLAMSDKTGKPIVPLVQNLKTSNKVYSTYDNNIDIKLTHLEELTKRSKYINRKLGIKKKIVDIIDREADSIAFMRAYQEDNRFFIIRGLDRVHVKYNNQQIKQKELARSLELGEYVKSIIYKKQNAKIYANEVDILITRDAHIERRKDDGTISKKKIKGEAVKARFIVERLVNNKQEIVATWILISNLKKDVSNQKIALWYYYRWNIESYFKLLKSSGFNLEQWQQVEPSAIFKRLLIASHASLLVWRIEHSNNENIKQIKEFLVKLSGRLVQRGKISTSPALLAGLWSFFSTMDIIELYDIDKLLSMRDELVEFMESGI